MVNREKIILKLILLLICSSFLLNFGLSEKGYAENDCYDLGYRYGMCSTKSLSKHKCKPENDVVITERCKDNPDTMKGINDGVKAVYDALNLDTDSNQESTQSKK